MGRSTAATLGAALMLGAAGAARAQEPDAGAILQDMARTLSRADALGVVLDTSWDVIQPDGLTIEAGEVRKVAVRRPDGVRADIRTATAIAAGSCSTAR